MTDEAAAPPSAARDRRRGDWLTRARVIGWGRVLLIVEIVALIVIAAGTYGAYVHLDEPSSTDFISFFAAGRLADVGTPWLAYDPAAHRAMERAIFGDPHLPYAYFFFYPPTYLVVCAVVALIPSYLLAFDPAAHRAMERAIFGDPHLPYAYFFFYPPTYLVVCAVVALIPSYLLAF